MSTKERKEHVVDAPLLTFSIEQTLEQLKQETQWDSGNRNAITLLKTPGLCVLLIALRKGARMYEHQVNTPFTLLVISGTIRFTVNAKQFDLKTHELATLGKDITHEVEALEESAVLLTLAYPVH